MTPEEEENAVLHAFLLAYRIIYDVHDIKLEGSINEDKTWLMLADVAEGRTILANSLADPRHPLHGVINVDPAVEDAAWATMNRVIVNERKVAEAILGALERNERRKGS